MTLTLGSNGWEYGMVAVDGALKPDESPENSREFARDAVRIYADLRLAVGGRFKVTVIDLSPAGFQIETGNHIPLNQIVYLTIPSFQPFQARVAWNYKDKYGCQLSQKIHNSVFQHIAANFPSLVTPLH